MYARANRVRVLNLINRCRRKKIIVSHMGNIVVDAPISGPPTPANWSRTCCSVILRKTGMMLVPTNDALNNIRFKSENDT
jgi:predicted nuclease with RNAse H fold